MRADIIPSSDKMEGPNDKVAETEEVRLQSTLKITCLSEGFCILLPAEIKHRGCLFYFPLYDCICLSSPEFGCFSPTNWREGSQTDAADSWNSGKVTNMKSVSSFLSNALK